MADGNKQLNLHFDVLPHKTKKAFLAFSKEAWLNKSPWYLAGGTALALSAGHRKSFDLDFFSEQRDFDVKKLITRFLNNKDWETEVEEKNTIFGNLHKAKVSFIAYPFFVPKQEPIRYGSIRVLHPLDIAVMKMIAISQRGRKRDFFDVYWSAQNLEPIVETIKRLKEQYPSVAHDYNHILSSLIYFEDAESDPAPEIYFKATWKGVKEHFRKEIPKITKQLIGLK